MPEPRTMHIVGFVPTHGKSSYTDDVRNGVEVSEHADPVHIVARDILGRIEDEGHTVHGVHTTRSLGGGWPSRVEAFVTVNAGPGRRGRDMWHVFTELRGGWPRDRIVKPEPTNLEDGNE